MTETATGGPETPSTARSRRYFPSFVREPGIELPPQPPLPAMPSDSNARVPNDDEALAAFRRFRELPTPKDNEIVQSWIAAAKDDPAEHARRIGLTK